MAPTSTAPEDPASGGPRTATVDPARLLPQVKGRHHSLDGVRGLACVMVLVVHVSTETGDALAPGIVGGLLSAAALAVPLFFCLSGVLLYRPWARATLDLTPGPRIPSYLWRRVMRVFPAYWVVAAVALLLWAGEYRDSARHWFEVMTLTFPLNTDPHWAGPGPYGLGQMWSLSVEVAFYLTLPLFALILHLWARGGRTPDARGRRLIGGMVVLIVLSFAALIPQYLPEYREYMHSWLPRCMGMFAVGMALATLSELAWRERGPDGPVRRLCRTLASSPGLCWAVAAAFYALEATPAAGGRFFEPGNLWISFVENATSIGFAFFMVAPAALAPPPADGPPPSLRALSTWRDGAWLDGLMRHRVVMFFARISYGMFLWQFVVLYLWRDFTGQEIFTGSFWLDFVPVLALSALLGTLTFHLVEEPSRKWSRRVLGGRKGSTGRGGGGRRRRGTPSTPPPA
ncbi:MULTISPECIES: acyltransferase family protein [Nocardiopsis]|uniref:Acyltransferase family protein n=1 Tax=Nocardiopsis alba TaxID=53437 RepID=A0A7K2IVM4_9ACTN|nr:MULTISPECIES: acyltransferase [Nocardiopsis]MEC3895002.1 acyltransferase [Nocardiopsis sp. LDBS1602]MYR33876.1 acyltransferase family protein [Nocardiopsis alba]